MDEQYEARRRHYNNLDDQHTLGFFPSCTHPECVQAKEKEDAAFLQHAIEQNEATIAKWSKFWKGA